MNNNNNLSNEQLKILHSNLISACVTKDFNLADCIIEKGADINFNRGELLLGLCKIGNVDGIKYLINKGVNLNINNQNNNQFMEEAWLDNQVSVVRLLLEHKVPFLKSQKSKNISNLYICAFHNWLELLKICIEQGQLPEHDNFSCLLAACSCNQLETSIFLFDYYTEYKNKLNNNPFFNFKNISKNIIHSYYSSLCIPFIDKLVEQCLTGRNYEMIKYLIGKNVDINLKNIPTYSKDNASHIWLENYINSKTLFNNLNEQLDNGNNKIKNPLKINKI